jgi:hypothetical protein
MTVPFQTEISFFGKFVQVLLFCVLSGSSVCFFPILVAFSCPQFKKTGLN